MTTSRHRRAEALAHLERIRDHLDAQARVLRDQGLEVQGGWTARTWLGHALPVVVAAFRELDTVEDSERLIREAEQHAQGGTP